MMRGFVGFIAALLAVAAGAVAAEDAASYAGHETRAIKALSAEDITALMSGDGMGFAKAAELNRYPGPRHVLDLAGPLGLDAGQKSVTESILGTMRRAATDIGAAIIGREAELDRLFAQGRADPDEVARQTAAIGDLQARLRAVHLNAHVAQRAVLRAEQIARYDALRGYGGDGGHALHGGHHP